ncbi:uncharacterized protein LOC131317395 [Rhododendron vialii]|uniref:uncharacterized protein LOC131317395 n=1 Tax=Rhododendron vialii TaxID=182163 RepID=UPI00265DEA7E|nr:uncharacterized protein LOC131317395 [Rhododendron vialii]
MSARDAARQALSNIAAYPFAKRLQDARLPSRVKHGAFILYETNADPVAHIQHYQQAMFMHVGDDAIMCKMFPPSLGKVALSWFHKLGPRSIRGWTQLAEEFTARFLMSRKAPKTFESLSTMKQGESKPIRDYAKKYWETFNEIESCSEEYAIATFKTGLPIWGELRRSLNMHPVATLARLMERIEQHDRMEDDILQEDGKLATEQTKGPAKKADKSEPKIYRERKEHGQAKKNPYKEKLAPDPKSGTVSNPLGRIRCRSSLAIGQAEEEVKMVSFLKEHVDVFAWIPEEMPGVDTDVICHHLNVDPQHKPII